MSILRNSTFTRHFEVYFLDAEKTQNMVIFQISCKINGNDSGKNKFMAETWYLLRFLSRIVCVCVFLTVFYSFSPIFGCWRNAKTTIFQISYKINGNNFRQNVFFSKTVMFCAIFYVDFSSYIWIVDIFLTDLCSFLPSFGCWKNVKSGHFSNIVHN